MPRRLQSSSVGPACAFSGIVAGSKRQPALSTGNRRSGGVAPTNSHGASSASARTDLGFKLTAGGGHPRGHGRAENAKFPFCILVDLPTNPLSLHSGQHVEPPTLNSSGSHTIPVPSHEWHFAVAPKSLASAVLFFPLPSQFGHV